MKTIKALVILLMIFTAPSWAAPKPRQAVRVLSTKRYVFHFKVEKELIGGSVEVLDCDQTLVWQEPIKKAKNILDFFAIKAGDYIIKIRKDSKEFTFEYFNME